MPIFDYSFTVDAPLKAVRDFHHDTSVLKKLTPPPIIMQLHEFEPLGEGSIARFTMWLGPIPLRFKAVHSDVSINGFTDTLLTSPLAAWQHTHRFVAIDEQSTSVQEHIEYEHNKGLVGLFTRLMFSPIGLRFLFFYRSLVTRRGTRSSSTQ
ncbi:MAG: hypothetical protein GYB68_19495 [Chloroflexi bacterium]|nr:hypothetical protein [Chloroflexota bacterium]